MCQGKSSPNARQSLCAESDCRASTTGLERSLQTHSFCLSCRQRSTTSEGLPGTRPCCAPHLSPLCSHFSSPLEQPQSWGGLPLDTTASQDRLCCAHPLASAAHLRLAWLLLGWTQGSAFLTAVLAVFSSSALSPTNLFVPMFLKPISLCNFPKLLGNLLSFSRFPFLISIYTLNSSTSFFTHGMSLFLMLDYFLHSLIQSDLFHS